MNLVEEKAECILTQLACDPGRDGEACKLISSTDATVPAYAPSAYSCAQTGKWELKQACAETQLCLITPAYSTNPDGSTAVVEQAVCTQIPCQEGLEYCPSISGKGNPYVCKDGVMQLKATCSETEGCVVDPNGSAGCLSFVNTPCTDGAEYCDMSSVARSCVSGVWTTKKVCSATQSCFVSGGLADCQDLCSTGTSQCSSTGVVQTCDSNGLWQDATICAPTQECVVYQGVVACRDKV